MVISALKQYYLSVRQVMHVGHRCLTLFTAPRNAAGFRFAQQMRGICLRRFYATLAEKVFYWQKQP